MKIFLYYIGKPRDQHANAIAAEFIKRSSRYSACEMREINPNRFNVFDKHPAGRKIFADPAGKQMDSQARELQHIVDQLKDMVDDSRHVGTAYA